MALRRRLLPHMGCRTLRPGARTAPWLCAWHMIVNDGRDDAALLFCVRLHIMHEKDCICPEKVHLCVVHLHCDAGRKPPPENNDSFRARPGPAAVNASAMQAGHNLWGLRGPRGEDVGKLRGRHGLALLPGAPVQGGGAPDEITPPLLLCASVFEGRGGATIAAKPRARRRCFRGAGVPTMSADHERELWRPWPDQVPHESKCAVWPLRSVCGHVWASRF